jgi:1-acyl-sn-glycerol-3-phosphate acyltransferase
LFYWIMKHVLVGPWLRLAFRPWTRGVEHVPDDGGAILASNHLAVIDSFVLPIVLGRQVKFLGKSDYFTGRGLKGRLVAGFMRGVGTIPVDRSGGKASEAALRTGLRVLDEGDLFGIYPEGTRSPDGRLYRGKTGVARLALESGAPVVPVAMIGTDVAQPLGRVVPKPRPIGVVFGEPLDFSRYRGMESDRFVLRSVADEIMYAILRLSEQEYVDVYAATAKVRLAQGLPVDPTPGTSRPAPAEAGSPAPAPAPEPPAPGAQDPTG